MTPSEQDLLRDSFAQVAFMPDVAGALFYERLFELRPDLRPLFRHDMRVQSMKLMEMLGVVIENLSGSDHLAPALRDMGRRHVEYGVADADYGVVGEALLWMLEQVLGEEFSPELRAAWAECYGELAREMLAGARG